MNNLRINKHSLTIVFFLIPCLVPAGLLSGGWIKYAFNLWRVLAFICILPKTLISSNKKNSTLIFSSLFSTVIIVSTYINQGVITSALSIAMLIFTTVALTEMEASRNLRLYIKLCERVCLLILIVDTVQIYTGIGVTIGNTTIMGGDNFATFSIIPMLGIIVVSETILYSKVRPIVFLFCLIVAGAKFITFAVTSMIAFLVLGLFLISRYFKKNKAWTIVTRVTIILLLFTIVFHFEDMFLLLSKLAQKETIVEHSRIGIWRASIQAISHKPWLGHGVLTTENEEIALIGVTWSTYSHTHNIALEVLFRGGIIGFFMYLMTFKNAIILVINGSSDLRKKIVRAFLIAFLVLCITDSYYGQAPIYILLALMPYIGNASERELKIV